MRSLHQSCHTILRQFYSPEVWKIQKSQTLHRLKLIAFWQIPPGARILEIGCGQGDTLAALSFTAGANGFVRGVDIAPADYGAPETLGQAKDRLLRRCKAQNLAIDLDCDIFETNFETDSFDYILLCHSLWYLPSYKTLCKILKRVRPWGKQLCIAEWDIRPRTPRQFFHQQAAWIQAVCACFSAGEQANIRTLLYPSDIKNALNVSGWQLSKEKHISSPKLQDGLWEVQNALELYPFLTENACQMPDRLRQLLLSTREELAHIPKILPLSVYCLCAKRKETDDA